MNKEKELKFNAEKFREVRENAGYEIEDVAYMWNTDSRYVEKVESGVVEPSIRELEQFSYMNRDVSIADFYGGDLEEDVLIDNFAQKYKGRKMEIMSVYFSALLGIMVTLLEVNSGYWFFGINVILGAKSEKVWYVFVAKEIEVNNGVLRIRMPSREFLKQLADYVETKFKKGGDE